MLDVFNKLAEIIVWCLLLCNKFGNGLAGLNHVVFCNPDFISVKSAGKRRKLGLESSRLSACHGLKRQHGLEQKHFSSSPFFKKLQVRGM